MESLGLVSIFKLVAWGHMLPYCHCPTFLYLPLLLISLSHICQPLCEYLNICCHFCSCFDVRRTMWLSDICICADNVGHISDKSLHTNFLFKTLGTNCSLDLTPLLNYGFISLYYKLGAFLSLVSKSIPLMTTGVRMHK